MGEAPVEAAVETMMKTVVKTVEALHDENRRRETEIPGRAPPIGKVVGRSIAEGVGIGGGGRRRNLVDLWRQSRRTLGNSPTPVGLLLAGLDARLLLLAADGHRNGVAAASRWRCGSLRVGVLGSSRRPSDCRIG
jgi:hypothetical protein